MSVSKPIAALACLIAAAVAFGAAFAIAHTGHRTSAPSVAVARLAPSFTTDTSTLVALGTVPSLPVVHRSKPATPSAPVAAGTPAAPTPVVTPEPASQPVQQSSAPPSQPASTCAGVLC